jgi:hypothetical protein
MSVTFPSRGAKSEENIAWDMLIFGASRMRVFFSIIERAGHRGMKRIQLRFGTLEKRVTCRSEVIERLIYPIEGCTGHTSFNYGYSQRLS